MARPLPEGAGADHQARPRDGLPLSAETFHELWACYRRAVGTADLTDDEMALLRAADVPEEHAYEIADLSDPDAESDPTTR